MFNEPTAEQLATIPGLYETEHISIQDKIIYARFFIGESQWFISEFDQVDTMFGFAILNGDLEMAEWGYVNYSDLKEINILGVFQVEYDALWEPKPAKEVTLIRRARFYA